MSLVRALVSPLVSRLSKSVFSMLDIDTVVIFGASIMEQSFSDSEDTVSKFLDAGIFVDVFERATSGDDTTQMLAKLPAVITEFQSIAARTLFVIHWGGNDVSRDGPFPGGADTMEANMRSMLSDIKSAGFKIMMSDISYRVPPASNPSQPYNDAFMYQLQSEYNDVDWFLQQFTFDNQVDIETDGIHPGAVLEEKIRQYLVVQSKAYIKPVAVETSIVKDLVIEFGAGALLKYRSQLNSIDANGTIFDLRNSDYSKIVGSSVTVTGAYGTNTSGRGNTADIGNDTASLFNDECLKDSLYITSSDTIYVDLSGLPLDDAGLYTVGVTASRKSDTGTKVSEYTVDGITLALDAELSPPGQVYFNNVTGANLRSNGIQVAVQDGSSFGYIGIASITEAG